MAELEDVTLDGKPLHSLRVADLKAALEQRGLAKSGQKTALIKRLKGALMLENLQRTSTPHSGLQPNSQIGEEMSQNSFIKQYLAKQQELLRQRMEREAREAAEADDTDSPTGPDEDDHSEANDDTFLPEKHHIVASRPPLSRAEEDEGGDRGGGLPQDPGLPGARRLDVGSAAVAQEPTDASSGRIWRPSFSQEDVATPSPPRAVASLSVRVIGQPERQGLVVHRPQEREGTAPVEAGPAHSMPQLSQSARMQEESDEDEDEDDDDSDEDDEWGPSSQRRRNIRAPPVHNLPASTAQRSRRKLQPPQHIPPPPPQPAHHSPLQLRQPTPPPSPPPELSFPLPDTPKQSPPDQDEPAAPGEGAAAGLHDSSSPPSLQRQESTSSSRSSSPEPPSQRRPGPLSLLVRKMESEGVFDKGQKKKEEENGDGAVEMTEQEDAEREDQETGQQKTEGGLGEPADDHATTGPVSQSGQQNSAQEVLPQEPEPAASVVPTAEYSDLEPKIVTEEKKKEEGRPKKQEKEEKEREELREEREKEIEKEPEKKKDNIHSSSKSQSEVSPNQGSSHFRHVSPTTSPPAVTKRPRMFSEVPPPECLLSPSKPEQVSVLVSGPQRADVDVAMETKESAAPESTPEKVNDQEKKLQAEKEKPASPRAGKAAEDTGKAPSVLPLSPPPEEGEAERVKEKPRRREKNTERHSSSSSHSSSSESDSESSSSSSSGSSSQDKSSPPSKKKDEVERTSKPVETEKETKKSYRDVKQAAVAEPTGPVAMELEERPESQSALAQPAPQGAPETAESRPDESTTTKAFAARKISLTSTKPEGASLTETESGGAASRKRRWGSSTAVTAKKPSISITTESLKSLIPDIKPLQEAVVELHPDEGRFSGDEDSSQQADREEDQGLKIRRTVTQIVPSEGQENGQKEREDDEDEEEEEVEERKQTEGEKDKPHRNQRRESVSEVAMETQEGEPKKVTPNDSVVRRSISQQKVSVTIDDPVRTGRQLSPPRGKISNIIHVCNLVRPFTLGQLKELLNRTGTVLEEGFWIDKIKSHCYVTYSSKEEAVATREALHGVKWPSSNPKVLRVDFCEQDELDFHKGLLPGDDPRVQGPGPVPRPAPPPPLMPPARERERERERERDSGPPVVRDQWAEREREMERRERTRSEREWDRDKVRDFGREDREAGRKSRSRDRDRRRKERGKSKERKAEKKDKPEEPPAKLLDDLFRKTKAAPCIYWLPLTEEQAAQRTLERAERMKEREKRRKELQEEEDKKREEDRKERARAREREGGNAGSGAGSSSRPADGERDKDRERERERERGREKEAEKRRDGNRGRPSDSKPVGGSRRSRSRSNPSRDRRR